MTERLIEEAGALLDRLAPFVTAQTELFFERELARSVEWRAIGPHRAQCNAQRLRAACEQARALLADVQTGAISP